MDAASRECAEEVRGAVDGGRPESEHDDEDHVPI
jgi:hypothetical protein